MKLRNTKGTEIYYHQTNILQEKRKDCNQEGCTCMPLISVNRQGNMWKHNKKIL